MMMKTPSRPHLLCSAVLLACQASAWAQTRVELNSTPEAHTQIALAFADSADQFSVELGDGPSRGERRVSGAPYCADAISESIQPLMDGNRIVRKTTTKLCRDGEGRTRQESEVGGQPRVYINDPVAKRHWVLDVKNKTAMQLPAAEALAGNPMASGQWQAYGDMMRGWAEKFSEHIKLQGGDAQVHAQQARAALAEARAAAAAAEKDGSGTPRPVIITEVRREVRSGKDGEAKAEPKVEREIRMYYINKDGEQVAMPAPPAPPAAPTPAPAPAGMPAPPAPPAPPEALPPLPPMPALMSLGHGNNLIRIVGHRGPGTTTSLGSKDIEGVRANGERTTWTIEAGKLGNEKPIVISREKWTSPDLMLTVLSRDVDPRTGENSYRLSNLRRGEPDAALFRLPADYKVQDNIVREKTVRLLKAPSAPAATAGSAPAAK